MEVLLAMAGPLGSLSEEEVRQWGEEQEIVPTPEWKQYLRDVGAWEGVRLRSGLTVRLAALLEVSGGPGGSLN